MDLREFNFFIVSEYYNDHIFVVEMLDSKETHHFLGARNPLQTKAIIIYLNGAF